MEGTILAWLFILGGAWLYFLPAITAWARKHQNMMAIFVLNLLLGWTLLGWAVAMVWACTKVDAAEPVAR